LGANPDKPELKIEDCKLNICGYRFALSFLFKMERIPYIFNLQSKIFNHYMILKISQYPALAEPKNT